MMQSIIQTTEDGSHTLFVPEIDESYHSTHGAIQESTHIFIEQGLKKCDKKTIHILEIGFGTGLNTLLTALEAERTGKKMHYTTLEFYPVMISDALMLNYPDLLNQSNRIFGEIHQATWDEEVAINPFFVLYKLKADFTTYDLTGKYDIIYFDAFSPDKQPEMWTEACFSKVFEHSNPNAILTTYCAKGYVRRALQQVGFRVERLPGPPGKREILRAVKL